MKFRLLILTAAMVVMAFGMSSGQGISVDHVDGLHNVAEGKFDDGATLVFHMRITGDSDPHLMLNNGFVIKSATLTWGDIVGDWNPAHPWATWFDFIMVLNMWKNGSVEDTVGLGLLSLMGSGLPVDFDDEAFTLTVGPISGPQGGTLVLDSSWYPPSNPWMWDIAAENVAWDGPHTYTLEPPTDVAMGDGMGLPTKFALQQNYPNPFNPTTEVQFDVPNRANVRIEIFNVLGQRVKMLVDEEMAAGTYVRTWDGRSDGGSEISSGVYFYKMQAGDFRATKKMMMLK